MPYAGRSKTAHQLKGDRVGSHPLTSPFLSLALPLLASLLLIFLPSSSFSGVSKRAAAARALWMASVRHLTLTLTHTLYAIPAACRVCGDALWTPPDGVTYPYSL